MSQLQSNFVLKAEDFDKYQWIEILNQPNLKQCQKYSEEFRARAESYQSSSDVLGQEVFNFLSTITSTFMDPLLNKSSIAEETMLALSSNEQRTLLRELVLTVADPEMQARIADILWICKQDLEKSRPIQMARVAAKSYLQAAKNLEDTENWVLCYERLQRAAQLAILVDGKKSTEMCCIVISHIDQLIDRYAEVEDEFITGSAMKVLQEDLRKSFSVIQSDLSIYATKCAEISAKKAVFAEGFQNHHRAFYQKIAYREIESEWYRIAGKKEAERNVRLQLAEVKVWYAQQALADNESDSYGVAAGRIKSAIKAFKKIEDTFGKRQDTFDRIKDLHKQMLDCQKKSRSQMISVRISEPDDFDDSEMQKVARELVQEKSLRDALYSLAFGGNLIPNFADLQLEAQQDIETNKILIPTAFVDEEGKTKAVSGDNEDSLEGTMFRIATFYQGWYGLNFIVPACSQIRSEHSIQLEDLSFIVVENPFIPKGRESLYARGLLAGFQGDTVIAAHLLIPQLENSLRYILKQNGFIASNLTSAMIQDEYTLNKILDLADLRQVLNEDIIFSLKGLLAERMGSNLRNEICRGLFSHDQFFISQIAYLWWFTLHLCLVPTYNKWVCNEDA